MKGQTDNAVEIPIFRQPARERSRRPSEDDSDLRALHARLSMTVGASERLFRALEGGATRFVISATDPQVTVRVRLKIEAVEPMRSDLIRGRLVVDWAQGIIVNGKRRVKVSRTELRLLSALVERFGETVSRHDLAHSAWPAKKGTTETGGALAVYIHTLRKRLNGIGLKDAIQTVRRSGYRFVVPPMKDSGDD